MLYICLNKILIIFFLKLGFYFIFYAEVNFLFMQEGVPKLIDFGCANKGNGACRGMSIGYMPFESLSCGKLSISSTSLPANIC